jgi:hypothetical protein
MRTRRTAAPKPVQAPVRAPLLPAGCTVRHVADERLDGGALELRVGVETFLVPCCRYPEIMGPAWLTGLCWAHGAHVRALASVPFDLSDVPPAKGDR